MVRNNRQIRNESPGQFESAGKRLGEKGEALKSQLNACRLQ